ncbi:universal stress protein [Halobacillus litoralis]|uniref:Universal stress protein n=1 Tax=Halobacillus litoralis TaxID=45668 RepID=A0A410MI31_9BACI|nr:universal stress protein [Halobacillus litoralis]QAS54392.1 universal stress protein [Halobacillus litoralis]
MYNRILLASDGSAHAARAAEHAVHLAKLETGATVTVLYCIDGSTSKTDVLKEDDRTLLLEKRKNRIQSTEKVLEEADVSYEVELIKGDPGPKIVEYANTNKFEVVVIGSRGLNGFQEMVLGSVSHKVAKRVNCPVMIVK